MENNTINLEEQFQQRIDKGENIEAKDWMPHIAGKFSRRNDRVENAFDAFNDDVCRIRDDTANKINRVTDELFRATRLPSKPAVDEPTVMMADVHLTWYDAERYLEMGLDFKDGA